MPYAISELARRAIDAGAHIFTWTDPQEMAWLADQAAKRRNVVEIGSYMGRTAKLFSVACPGPIYCVDHFETAGVQKVFEHFLAPELKSGKVTLCPTNSVEGAHRLAPILAGNVDMLFIDDGHLYADVVNDIKSWLPLMAPGGIVCGHDYYIEKNGLNDVAKAVNDLLPKATPRVLSVWAVEL